jgi:hypothetical protein
LTSGFVHFFVRLRNRAATFQRALQPAGHYWYIATSQVTETDVSG